MSQSKHSYKMAIDQSHYSIHKKCVKSFLYSVTNRSNLEFMAYK